MLSLFNHYVLEPVVEATKNYVIFPIAGALTKIVTAAATKNISTSVTAAVANNIVGQADKPDASQLTDATVSRLANLQEKGKNILAGCAIENTTSASLKLLNAVTAMTGPGPKMLTTVLPKAYRLALTTPPGKDSYREVLVGVTSHTAGAFMQESVDSLLPHAAPYGGYVAYGIGNGLTKVGLERAFRR